MNRYSENNSKFGYLCKGRRNRYAEDIWDSADWRDPDGFRGCYCSFSSDPLAIPGAQVIQGKGKTLMPGLIDCHVHIQGLNNRCEADSMAFLKDEVPRIFQEKVFPYGITTIKDLCAPRHFIYQLREQLRSGRLEGPELLIVGPNFTAPDGHPANTLGEIILGSVRKWPLKLPHQSRCMKESWN